VACERATHQDSFHSAVGKKILIDQLIYAPVFTCVLYSYLQFAHGDLASIPEVLQVCATDVWLLPDCVLLKC
jgi:hypothetical protein